MNLMWLRSASGKESAFAPGRGDATAVDSAEDAASVASRHPSPVLIIEVLDANDAGRAFDHIDGMRGICPVWICAPYATARSAVSFMKAGAAHVISTPEEMENAMEDAMERAMERAIGAPAEPSSTRCRPGRNLIGMSRAMQAVAADIDLVASRHCNVLIEGETGTGKEVVAREIHQSGGRARGPWVAVNCGAIPEPLLEAELFGHARGAFTGAVQARVGKFEAANHGTIFLDEIGDMPVAIQAKLLRVLQEKEVERLGGNERIRLDIRVIAATNANLREKVRNGSFRQDLYYRLNVFQISLAPLRERPADIPVLARHFVARICRNENLKPKILDATALGPLLEHSWPGNARELENVIETAIILSGTRASIFASDIRLDPPVFEPAAGRQQISRPSLPGEGLDYQKAIETFELDLLTQALARTRGNKRAAADLLRLKRTTLSARMKVLESRLPRLVMEQAAGA